MKTKDLRTTRLREKNTTSPSLHGSSACDHQGTHEAELASEFPPPAHSSRPPAARDESLQHEGRVHALSIAAASAEGSDAQRGRQV